MVKHRLQRLSKQQQQQKKRGAPTLTARIARPRAHPRRHTLQQEPPSQLDMESIDREKLRILQALNEQIQAMTVKLDQIVSQVEEVHYKIPQTRTLSTQLIAASHSVGQKMSQLTEGCVKLEPIMPLVGGAAVSSPAPKRPRSKATAISAMSRSHLGGETAATLAAANAMALARSGHAHIFTAVTEKPDFVAEANALRREGRSIDTTAKRNKQQRLFNTFVRESIGQLLGTDFMRDHDVQDIDASVMEMIRKEAVENYLPENIRPRRAWHLAKASLRTLKRTLNNKKI